MENRICNYSNGSLSCGDCKVNYFEKNGICVKNNCENNNVCNGLLDEISYEEYYNNLICKDDAIEGKQICLNDYNSADLNNKGLLICEENNFEGICHFETNESLYRYWADTYWDDYRFINSFRLDLGLEACSCNSQYYPASCICYSAKNEKIIKKSDAFLDGEYIKVFPASYEKFKIKYPNKKYLKLYNEDMSLRDLKIEPDWGQFYYLYADSIKNIIINKNNIAKISFESKYKLIIVDFDGNEIQFDPWSNINEENPNPDDYIFDLPSGLNISLLKLVSRTTNSNAEEGIYLCVNSENCYNINNHITFDPIFNPEYSNCGKAEIFIPGDDICVPESKFRDLSHTLFLLSENWEVFICLNEDDDIKDCDNYYSYSGWNGGVEGMKKIIVQPKLNTPEFDNFYANKEYVIVYDEPNYNGNHIIYSLNTVQNNSIHRVRSIETSSTNIRTYLNIDSLKKSQNYKDTVTNLFNKYNIKNDKYLTDTDSTSFIFDEQTLNNGNGIYYHNKNVFGQNYIIPNDVNKKKYGYKSIRLDIKKENKFKTVDIENDGVEISIKNFNKCEYLSNTYFECDSNRNRKFRKLCYGTGQDVCDYGYECYQSGNEWSCVKNNSCTEYSNPNEEHSSNCPKGYICNMNYGRCEVGCLNDNQCDYDQYCDLSNGVNYYNQDYCEGNNCLKGTCVDYPPRHLYSSIKKGVNSALAFPKACESNRVGNNYVRDYCDFSIFDTSFDIKINEKWEAYYCPIDMMANAPSEILRDKCVYLNEGINLAKNDIEASNNWGLDYYLLGAIFINTKNYDKFIQYHGHSEYGEKGKGLKGYIELFTKKEFKGKREVIWESDANLSDNLILGNKIKSIKVVGNIRPKFKKEDGSWEYLSRNDTFSNTNNYMSLRIDELLPTFKAIRSNDTPTPEYAWGFFYNYPQGDNGITREYLRPDDGEVTADLILENEKQAESFDGADLILQDSHGTWRENAGSSPYYSGNGDWIDFWDPLKGGSIGDLDLEWFLTGSCQSLGKNDRTTSAEEAIWAYRELFVNGLHGFGGFWRDSFWGDEPFYKMGMRFWSLLYYDKLPIGKAWVALMYKDDPVRNAGFVSPGSCSNYMHNDYWFKVKSGPKNDPSKSYLKNNGFCYYSHANGSRDFEFSRIIGANALDRGSNNPRPEENWPIYNEVSNHDINNEFKTCLRDYILDDIKLTPEFNALFYIKDNKNDNIEIDIDSDNFNPDIPEKQLDENLIKELFLNAYTIISLAQDKKIISNIYLGDIKNGYGLEQEFSYYGERTKAMINEIFFIFKFHSGTGYFSEANEIKIGFNPINKNIITFESTIKELITTTEYINGKLILKDLNKFKNRDKTNIYKAKYVKFKNQYRPAILKYDSFKHTVLPIKVY